LGERNEPAPVGGKERGGARGCRSNLPVTAFSTSPPLPARPVQCEVRANASGRPRRRSSGSERRRSTESDPLYPGANRFFSSESEVRAPFSLCRRWPWRGEARRALWDRRLGQCHGWDRRRREGWRRALSVNSSRFPLGGVRV
jgi:hypothetical protein